MSKTYKYPATGGVGIADPVANFASLPPSGAVIGQLIVTQDTGTIYEWNGTTWQVAGGGGGSGDVSGPASSVNNQVALFSGTTGKVIKASTASGVAKLSSGVLSAGPVNLASEVTGVTPVANGGTNSAVALSGNKAIVSDTTGIIEHSTTTSTEVGYLAGVTSAIQTQLNSKVISTRVVATTAPLTGGGDLSADRNLSIPKGTGAVDGYIAATDFAIFAAKVGATRAINTTGPLSGGGDLSADRTISIAQSTASVDGYLAAADFASFASKQPAGNYITALTGDVAAAGPGSAAATIQPGAVTNAKIAAGAGISVNKLAALTASSPVRSDGSGFLTTGPVDLASSDVTGVLPVSQGGTGDPGPLANNRFIISTGGTITENAAVTGNRALATNASGLPVASATTDTELGYVSGVTSAIQTQINAKVNKAGDTMTGFLTLNADPTSALHAVTKQYADNLAQGLSPKQSALLSTTGNITLVGEQTIDGVLTSASRVLVRNQSLPAENGLYTTGAGAWTRTLDMDAWSEVPGAFVFVEEGTLYADTGWVCTSDPGGTLGVTAVTFVQFAGAGTYTTDGQGLLLTGTQLSLVLNGTTLAKSASGLKVNAGGITDTEINAAAAITRSKLAAGTPNRLAYNAVTTGVLTDLAAITANKALASDANGLPVAVATTDTELGYVAGVTSAIQTQLNGKQATGNYITSLTGDVVAAGPGAAAATIQPGAVDNNKIANAAGIAVNKLAALTASRAVVSDSSGFLAPATTTATEIGYVNGVTSPIQTQINSILAITSVVAVAGNVTLTNKAIHLVDTSSARTLTLPAPSTSSLIVIKDKTGSANTNNITVARAGTEKIETVAASFALDYGLGSWTFVSDGTDWFIV